MPDTPEMVERVARAIFDTAVGADKWDNDFWREERDGCFRSARAAIEAMREPTADMIRAYNKPHTGGDWDAIQDWQNMLDAALGTPHEQVEEKESLKNV